MSWFSVARKEFQDAIRSRWLIGLTVLFVLFAGGFTYLFRFASGLFAAPGTDNTSTIALLSAIGSSTTLLVPLIGLVVGYKSIVGERDSGSLKLLLGLPNTRRDIVLGKLAGRSAVVAVSVLVGFAVAAVVGLVFYDSFAPVPFLVYTVLAIVLGVVFIAIAVGFSAAMRSTTWALLGAGFLYILFQFLWNFIPLIALFVVNGFSLSGVEGTSNWIYFFYLLNPQNAFSVAAATVVPALSGLGFTAGSQPFYLQNWFGFVVLAAWIVVPLVLGYLRFDSTDL